MIVNRKTEKAN